MLRWNEGLLSAGCDMQPFAVGGKVTILSDSAPIRLPDFIRVRIHVWSLCFATTLQHNIYIFNLLAFVSWIAGRRVPSRLVAAHTRGPACVAHYAHATDRVC